MLANSSDEDTVLGAFRGLAETNVTRIFCRLRHILVVLTVLLGALSAYVAPVAAQAVAPPHSDAPLVALASSFRSVWPVLMERYQREPGRPAPLTSFASSGLLSTQILRGAPFELFLSADQKSVARIMAAGKTQSDPRALAIGRLSLVTLLATRTLPAAAPTLVSIKEALTQGNATKIAIPNPRHAPYGIAAQQALTSAGLWPLPYGTLLNAENASQALQYVLNGAVSVAIVPTTLVTQTVSEIAITPIDPDSYEPVTHHIAVLTPAGDSARELAAWLSTPQALTILTQFGLTPPRP